MDRIEREKRTVERMIRLYCRRKEHNAELCEACRSLLSYACRRLETCRYGPLKGSCKQCTVHCYAPAQREKIRAVMRYAGPRMLLYHRPDHVFKAGFSRSLSLVLRFSTA